MSEEGTKLYEISFLSKGEDSVAVLIKHIKQVSGEIVHEGSVKEIELAYPIKKERSAYFGCIKSNLPKDSIDELSKALNFEKDILRFLVINPIQHAEVRAHTRPQQPVDRKPVDTRTAPRPTKPSPDISNELLEEKLEEILK